MIIFDLDGTLADCEHRRHFVDAEKAGYYECGEKGSGIFAKKGVNHFFKPDWKSFYEACYNDHPIIPTFQIFSAINRECICPITKKIITKIEIWSTRCESVRYKTLGWLAKNGFCKGIEFINLKMRPEGDSTPDDVLKEKWLDEAIAEGKKIDFVFDDRPKCVRMWRRRGIFVFNCLQHDEEF